MLKRNIDQTLKIAAILVLAIPGIYVFAFDFKPVYVIASSILGLVLWFSSVILSNKNKSQKNEKESKMFNIIINVMTFAILFIIFAIASNRA